MSISNTPQAKDDVTSATEDHVLTIDVMGNDLGGNAKSLYSLNQANPLTASPSGLSAMGATVRIVGGVVTYDSSGAAAVQALADGQTATDTFNYVIQLGNGTLSVATVTVTVTGTNDAPVLAVDTVASHAMVETAGSTGSSVADTASATLNFSDLDLNDTHSVTIAAPTATWSAGATPAATLTALGNALTSQVNDSTHTGAGSVALSLSVADKAFDFLGAGETLTVTYNVTLADTHGGSATRPVTFVVTGTNDGPVLAADPVSTHALTETAGATGSAAADAFSTTLAFTDVDLTDGHTATVGVPSITWSAGQPLPGGLATTLGGALTTTLTDSTGTGAGSVAASFTAPDNAFDFLGAGQTLTITYDVKVSDGHGGTSSQPVTIVVTGTNDGPVLGADAASPHALAEADGVTSSTTVDSATATLAFTDVDLTDHHTVTVATHAIEWSGGATLPGGLASVLANDLHTVVSENQGVGTVTATFAAPDAVFDFLGAGETLKVTYDVTLDDGHGGTSTQPVTFVVTGSNDAPVLSADPIANHFVQEHSFATGFEGVLTATATLVGHDADLNDVHTAQIGAPAIVWSGGAGLPAGLADQLALAIDTEGTDTTGTGLGSLNVTFTAPDKTFDFLAVGETLKVTYNVTMDDGHGGTSSQPVTFTVVGSDDVPVLSAQGSLEHVVNGGFEQSDRSQAGFGWTTTSDAIEINPASVYNVTGGIGKVLELDANSTTPRDDVSQTFATTAGQAYNFSFDTALRSGTSGPDNTFEVLWNGVVIDTVTAHSTAMEHHSYTVFGDGGPGTIEFRELPTNNNSLGGIIDNVSVKDAIAEQTGQTGLAAADSSSVTLALTDADLSDVHSVTRASTSVVWSGGANLPSGVSAAVSNALTTTLSDTTHTGAGSLTATFAAPDATFDFLGAGETLTVTYGLSVNDGHGGVATRPVTFVVTGTNDAPVLSAQASPLVVAEKTDVSGQAATDTGSTQLHFTDVDLNDQHTLSVGAPTLSVSGGAVLPANLASQLSGSLTAALSPDSLGSGAGNVVANFAAPDSAFDFLGAGQSLTVTYNVTVSDGHGGTSTQPVVVTINGANDAPTVSADSATTLEDTAITITSARLVGDGHDLDSGDTLHLTGVSGGVNGTVALDANGNAVFTPNLNAHGSNGFNYTLSDGHGGTVTGFFGVNITAVSDAPSLAVTGGSGSPGQAIGVSISTAVTDPAEHISSVVVSGLGSGMTLSDNAGHSFTSASAGGSVNVAGWNLSGLSFTAPGNFSGNVALDVASSSQDGTAAPATTHAELDLHVSSPASAPTLTVGSGSLVLSPTDGAAMKTVLTLHAGDVVSFDWNFAATDYVPFYDFAFASVNNQSFVLSNVNAVGSYGHTGWETFTYVAPTDGTYTIGQGVMNHGDTILDAYLWVDNMKVNGGLVQGFESGFGSTVTTGSVTLAGPVSLSSGSAVISVSPDQGTKDAELQSNPQSESALETFLGLPLNSLKSIATPHGVEHSPIALPITVTATGATPDDTYVTISGAPTGSVFNHGVFDAATNTWKVEAAQVSGLTITTASDYVGSFSLSVTATSVIGSSSATSGAQTMTVQVDAASVTLTGTAADEVLKGGSLADTISSGGGSDTLTGGASADHFVFANLGGASHVTDFTSGDQLDLTAFGTTFSALDSNGDGVIDAGDANGVLSVTSDSSGLTLHFSSGGSVLIGGVNSLHSSDLLF